MKYGSALIGDMSRTSTACVNAIVSNDITCAVLEKVTPNDTIRFAINEICKAILIQYNWAVLIHNNNLHKLLLVNNKIILLENCRTKNWFNPMVQYLGLKKSNRVRYCILQHYLSILL